VANDDNHFSSIPEGCQEINRGSLRSTPKFSGLSTSCRSYATIGLASAGIILLEAAAFPFAIICFLIALHALQHHG